MFVGSQGDTAHVTLGIIGHLGLHRIDGDSLEDSLHGLVGIHRNRRLGILADDSTSSILPFLKLITEVLGGFQRHLRTFLILFQIGVAVNGTSLGTG